MTRRRQIALGSSIVACALLAYALFGWFLPMRRMVGIGSAMLAKQVCSCIYIGGRDLEPCRLDQMGEMDAIPVHVDPEARRVTAALPTFPSHSAVYRDGLGCTLE